MKNLSTPRGALLGAAALLLATPAHAERAAQPQACAPFAAIHFSTPPQFETASHRFPSGGVELGGCLYRPPGLERFPVVVLVAGSDDGPTAASIYTVIHAKAFTAKGIGVFSFDKRGLGDSTGIATDTDFSERAADVAAAVRFVRTLPSTRGIGVWGGSQAGWVVPQALHAGDGVELVMLVSPAGVNPNDQVAYFIHHLALDLGLDEPAAAEAEQMHRTVVRYYGTGRGYEEAQAVVDRLKDRPWFERFRTNDQWDEKIGPGGRLLDETELATAWREHPGDFEFQRAASTFADYAAIYAAGLDRPTLIVNGSADTLVPYERSNEVFAAAFRANGNHAGEIKTFAGATHGIQDGPHVRPDYLEFLSDWAARHFARP